MKLSFFYMKNAKKNDTSPVYEIVIINVILPSLLFIRNI